MKAGATSLNFMFSTTNNWSENFDTPALPLNVKTVVIVQATENMISVSYNGVVVATRSLLGTRFFGPASIFNSSPIGAANAVFGEYSLVAVQKPPLPSFMTDVGPMANRYAGRITISSDYSLSFEITPKANTPPSGVYQNILWAMDPATTADGLSRSRMIGVWFVPGTTSLFIRTGTDYSFDEGFARTPALPLNLATVVTIETAGKIVRVSYNGKVVAATVLQGNRLIGVANLYASTTLPGYVAPNALFGKFSMFMRVGKLPLPSYLIDVAPMAVNAYGGIVNVPADWTLSFQITPQAIAPGYTNVLWFMDKDTNADGLARSRMIAIWLQPGTTGLHVRTGTNLDWNAGINLTPNLSLNVATVVKIEAFGQTVRVSYNNNVVSSMVHTGTRLSGLANLFVAKDLVPKALFGKLSFA
jgi:uncharacterized protein (DUF427 family)